MALNIDVLYSEGSSIARDAIAELARTSMICKNFPAICEVAAKDITPDVRSELGVSYGRTHLAKSGAWDNSGAMYAGWVTNSIIKANQQGILVYVAKGMPDKVYKRIGTFQHGATHGVAGNSVKARKTRVRIKAAQGNAGLNINYGGKVWVQAPRPVEFDATQMDRLAVKYVNAVNKHIAKVK